MATFHIEILRENYSHLTSISICFAKSQIFSNAKMALPLKLYNIERTLHTTNKEINIRIFSPHTYQNYRPRSPTARVHVAAGGNIIWNPFLLMAKCRGDGREPSQRAQRAVVATRGVEPATRISPSTTPGASLPPLRAPVIPSREAY